MNINNLDKIYKFTELENNTSTIKETQEEGECIYKVNFDDDFIRIYTENSEFERAKEMFQLEILRKKCDGIIITNTKLILIELKTTFNINSFIKALNQLLSSYVKVKIFFGKFEDLEKIDIEFIIASKIVNNFDKYEISKQEKILSNKGILGDYFWILLNEREITLKEKFPFPHKDIVNDKEVLNILKPFIINNLKISLKECE